MSSMARRACNSRVPRAEMTLYVVIVIVVSVSRAVGSARGMTAWGGGHGGGAGGPCVGGGGRGGSGMFVGVTPGGWGALPRLVGAVCVVGIVRVGWVGRRCPVIMGIGWLPFVSWLSVVACCPVRIKGCACGGCMVAAVLEAGWWCRGKVRVGRA